METEVANIVKTAEEAPKIAGLGKWMYYMTFAWVFEPKKAQVNWRLTKAVWDTC
jgi:hypothetical protein